MARQKKNKIEEKGVLISINEKGEMILTSEMEEELITENLTESILNLSKEFGSLVISVKDYAPKNSGERAPTYKYKCSCGKEIKSKEENLKAICEDCNCEFEILESE